MAIDTHVHVNSLVLKNQEEHIQEINTNNQIESVINVGLNLSTSKESILLSTKNHKFYSAIGIHPLYTEQEDFQSLYDLLENQKVVAIGEIGLDTTKNNLEEQKKYFIRQIIIANNLQLPVIIHANNTNKEIIEIFEKYVKPKYGCVFHCFQPDIESLKYLIKNGYYISFAGRITYKNAKKSLEVAQTVPDELFLVETDSPYIAPEPFKNMRNRPNNIKYIIEKLCEIKKRSYEEIEEQTSKNARRLFKKLK